MQRKKQNLVTALEVLVSQNTDFGGYCKLCISGVLFLLKEVKSIETFILKCGIHFTIDLRAQETRDSGMGT